MRCRAKRRRRTHIRAATRLASARCRPYSSGLVMSALFPDHDADALIGTTLSGEYELSRYIGGGGMGSVYEAARCDGVRVAVKILSAASLDHESLRRFVREAAIPARVS